MGNSVTVARVTLAHLVGVRIPVPQFFFVGFRVDYGGFWGDFIFWQDFGGADPVKDSCQNGVFLLRCPIVLV